MKRPSRFLKVCLIGLVCILVIPFDSSQKVQGQDGDGGSSAPACFCPCPITAIAAPLARSIIDSMISGSIPDGTPTTEIDQRIDSVISQIANMICMCPCQINTITIDDPTFEKMVGAVRDMRDGLSGSVVGQSLSKVYYSAVANTSAP